MPRSSRLFVFWGAHALPRATPVRLGLAAPPRNGLRPNERDGEGAAANMPGVYASKITAMKIPHRRLDTITNHASISRMLKSFAALFLLSASAVLAQTNPTAYDALRTVGNQVNRDYVNRVISVTGLDGNPQPSTWRILVDDPNARGIREVEVRGGRVTSNRTSDRNMVGTAQSATINPARLNLDSSGAYEVASRTADSSHVPFAYVNYTLRTNERGDGTWIVTLQNQNHRPVGTIYIGANKGTVTRTEGMFAGAPMDAVVEDHREGDVEDEERSGDNPIMRSVRNMFYRAREQASETFKRVRHNFADFIRGND